MSVVSADQRERFRRDGYLVLEGFVSHQDCDALRARADALVSELDPTSVRSVFTTRDQAKKTDAYFLGSGDTIRFFFEEHAFDASGELAVPKARALNKIGHAMHDLDPVFDRFSRAPNVAELTRDLGVVDARLMQSMYIFKQPRIGGEVRCHQDATFLHSVPESVVGLWFALEDATVDNGCLWALPGGHTGGLKSIFVRNEDDTTAMREIEPASWDESKLVPLPAPKGTLVVLHGLLPHMSRENRSEKSRHAYTLHVVPAASAYPRTNWLRRSMPARGF